MRCGATLRHGETLHVCALAAGHYDGPAPGSIPPGTVPPHADSWHCDEARAWLDTAEDATPSPDGRPAGDTPNRAGYSAGRVCYPTAVHAALGDAREDPRILGVAWWPDRDDTARLARLEDLAR